MVMQHGDVRWCRFGAPDKKRPVVVLTRTEALEFLNEVTVAPVTSRTRDVPSEVGLDESDGMLKACAVNLYHVHTVQKNRVGSVITKLTDERMDAIRQALLFALGFDR